MKKEKIYKLVDKYLESEFISENDEIELSLPHINRFINNIDRELKLELADNISPEDYLLPILNDLVIKFPDIRLSLYHCSHDKDYTIYVSSEDVCNSDEFIKISDEIMAVFSTKYDNDIWFSYLHDDDYYYWLNCIVLTGKEYKN